MASERLPGKVLRPLGDDCVLGLLLSRLARAETLESVVLVTSSERSDDPLVAFCRERDTPVERGPHGDVAARFAGAAQRLGAGAFVRVSGDSPLLDPALVDRAVTLFGEDCDVVTNTRPRTFPPGQSVEVVRAEALQRAHARMSPEDREHVTPRLYAPDEGLRIRTFTAERDYGALRLTVDTAADLERMRALLTRMDRPPDDYGLDDVAELAAAPA